MNPLQRALIEKAGHDFGFEYVAKKTSGEITLASARHPVQAHITLIKDDLHIQLANGPSSLIPELARSFPIQDEQMFICRDIDSLANLLNRSAALGRALPNQVKHEFNHEVEQELKALPENVRGTEIERMVRQRVGQQTYRQAMLEYWGGACAVTGITIPAVLRASHAKPWADCESDAERLDVFNGFLLSANLDALFDRFLISFSHKGEIMVASCVNLKEQQRLGLGPNMRLRWLAPEHLAYLNYHRKQFYTFL